MTEFLIFNSDYSWVRRGSCLGYGQRVVTARDPHVMFCGKRDGRALVAVDTAPQRMQATNAADLVGDRGDVFVLGVAHRACVNQARQRLERQEVELPLDLLPVRLDEDASDLPRLGVPPDGAHCPFCGNNDTTAEHVFPGWISEELRKRGALTRPTPHGTRQLRKLDYTVPLCAHCNHRWLSVLETDARPILAPMINGVGSFTLDAAEQRLLAAWGAKTALMLDLLEGAVVPAGAFYAFRQQRSTLPSMAVWIGAYVGGQAVWADHHGIPAEDPKDVVTTFVVGRVLFQVVTMIAEGSFGVPNNLTGLWRIAPEPDESIMWPRDDVAFGDETIVQLAASVTA